MKQIAVCACERESQDFKRFFPFSKHLNFIPAKNGMLSGFFSCYRFFVDVLAHLLEPKGSTMPLQTKIRNGRIGCALVVDTANKWIRWNGSESDSEKWNSLICFSVEFSYQILNVISFVSSWRNSLECIRWKFDEKIECIRDTKKWAVKALVRSDGETYRSIAVAAGSNSKPINNLHLKYV